MELSRSFEEEFNNRLNQLRRFTKHGPSLGRFTEILLLNLLKKYFPKVYDFSSGFVVTMDPLEINRTSSQLDIICFDRKNYPIVFDESEIVVVVPNSVKGIVEVKATLTINSINQILDLSKLKLMNEISEHSMIYLLGVNSKVSPHKVFEYLSEFYLNNKDFKRFLGGIFCLGWDSVIECSLTKHNANQYTYSISHLENSGTPIGNFSLKILFDVYGKDVGVSIANQIGPTLRIVHNTKSFSLTNTKNHTCPK